MNRQDAKDAKDGREGKMAEFDEGRARKGGVNKPATIPKPGVRPPGQRADQPGQVTAEPTEADVEGTRCVLADLQTQVRKAKRGQAGSMLIDARYLARHVADAHAEERKAVRAILPYCYGWWGDKGVRCGECHHVWKWGEKTNHAEDCTVARVEALMGEPKP